MMSVLRSWVTQRKQYTLQIQASISDQHTLNLLVDDKMQKLKKESSTMQQVVHIHVDVIQAAELLLIRHEQLHHFASEQPLHMCLASSGFSFKPTSSSSMRTTSSSTQFSQE